MTSEREAARILAEYARREREIGRELYALTRPANLFIRHGQDRALLRALASAKALPLAQRRILEVGCGRGQWLQTFDAFGASPDRLAGIDLDSGRVEEATRRFPQAELRVGDASVLPWPDDHFDVVFQSTMFTSILDEGMRAAVAREMLRVLAPAGTIISYDFRYANPRNRNVRPVTVRDLEHLFPACTITAEAVTLAPPIARRLVPRTWLGARVLERIPWLNTHLMAVIRRRS